MASERASQQRCSYISSAGGVAGTTQVDALDEQTVNQHAACRLALRAVRQGDLA